MDVGRRDDGRELPSQSSPSLMHSSLHVVGPTATNSSAAAAKLKAVLQASNSGSNGGGLLAGPCRVISGASTPSSSSSGYNAITVVKNNGLSLGGSYGANPGSCHHRDDLKLPASMELMKQKKPVKYRECLKNHAANHGGHATDGCGEFMPSGEEGTLEALTCAACSCHRNFHRREMEGETGMCSDCRYDRTKAFFPSPLPLPSPTVLSAPPHMIMAFNPGSAPAPDSDEYDTGGLLSPHSSSLMKKRFRTKFTLEQKEQMAAFAHKLGWRIQKHDEEAVQQFCAEVGVKRHVLKVWMHNNKLTMAKKPPCCLTMTPENPDVN